MTDVKCGFEGWSWVLIASVPDLCIFFTVLSSLIFSMNLCKILVVAGFVQNVIFSTSQSHSFLSS